MQFNFEWDPQKAQSNQIKHGVRFELAASVFRDPHAASIYDEKHSTDEDRWLTPRVYLQPVFYLSSTILFKKQMTKQ